MHLQGIEEDMHNDAFLVWCETRTDMLTAVCPKAAIEDQPSDCTGQDQGRDSAG